MSKHRPSRLSLLAVAALGLASQAAAARDVVLVDNAVAGTVSFLDGHTFANLGTLNIIPDLQERMQEIKSNPLRSLTYNLILNAQLIPHFEPSGGERYLDDMFLSPDGNTLYASRTNLGDVAAFDMTKPDHPMLWRTVLPLFKSDHAAISPDGKQLVVSASAVNEDEIIDTATGAIVGSFPTGLLPHQNDYSRDGKLIYNGSLGALSLPYSLDFLKGPRLVTVADAHTFKVLRTYSLPEGVRPTVISDDGNTMYVQQSYLNGLIKYDMVEGKIIAKVEEPLSDFAKENYPTFDDYPHNSAHHGLAMSKDGTKLCDLGTIDNTVSIVSTADLEVTSTIDVGLIPYWATTSVDGNYCIVSLSGDASVVVVDYRTGQQVTKVTVGKFPQRSRIGTTSEANLSLLSQDK